MKKKNKVFLMLITFLGMGLLSSCDTSDFSESMKEGIIDALIPNFWAFLTQFLAFVVLVVLVSIFAYKPLKNFMDKRSEYLDNEVKTANKNNAMSKVNLEESESNIAKSRKEASKIIDSAKNDAVIEKQKILDDANMEIIKMKTKAEKDIENGIFEAQKQVKNEIINVALDASEHVLGREINKDDNAKIVDDFIDTIKTSQNKESETK